MNEEKVLSVIVPVYKVEPYLKRCIDSIIHQTYKNLQIILVDDGSPDLCGSICDEYTQKDSRIIAVHQKNEGLSGARNNGMLFAKGEYIAFVDSDDWLHPTMYEVLINLIEKNNLDIAKCSVTSSDGNNESQILPRKRNRDKIITGKNVFDLYYTEFLCKVVWNAVYKRKIVNGILSPVGYISEDNYVSGRYLYRSTRMMITSKCLYYYYKNPTSITHSPHKSLIDICMCTQMLRDDLLKEDRNIYKWYICKLNKKLARELYHFIRYTDSRYRICSITHEQKKFIENNLDVRRRIIFMVILIKKHIKII